MNNNPSKNLIPQKILCKFQCTNLRKPSTFVQSCKRKEQQLQLRNVSVSLTPPNRTFTPIFLTPTPTGYYTIPYLKSPKTPKRKSCISMRSIFGDPALLLDDDQELTLKQRRRREIFLNKPTNFLE